MLNICINFCSSDQESDCLETILAQRRLMNRLELVLKPPVRADVTIFSPCNDSPPENATVKLTRKKEGPSERKAFFPMNFTLMKVRHTGFPK